MNIKKIIPLTFSAVSLASIPSVVCSCGNQYQQDYTIRCDTNEITWSLSQTTETEETSKLYTKDTVPYNQIWVNNSSFGAYLHKEYDDGQSLGKNIIPHFSIYSQTLSFTNLDQTTAIGSYWIEVTGLNYGDDVYGKGSLSHNYLWFQFNVIE